MWDPNAYSSCVLADENYLCLGEKFQNIAAASETFLLFVNVPTVDSNKDNRDTLQLHSITVLQKNLLTG